MSAKLAMLLCTVGLAVGCSSVGQRLERSPGLAASLDEATLRKIQQGEVEIGFSPQMVYAAKGAPTSPLNVQVEKTVEGTWSYRGFPRNDRDYIRGGFRHRIVFDPVRKSDVRTVEPVDGRLYPHLQVTELQIVFREGKVGEVRRVPL